MTAQNRTTLKGYFNTGDAPTESQFADLVDSFPTIAEHDTKVSTANVKTINGASVLGSGDLVVGGPFAIVTEATTARTLALTDAQKYIRCTSSSSTLVTVPPQASVAWAADTEIMIERAGAGALTIAAGAGVTLRSPRTLVADSRYSVVTLKRVALNEWVVAGGTV